MRYRFHESGDLCCPRCSSFSFHTVRVEPDEWTSEPRTILACNGCQSDVPQASGERMAQDASRDEALGERDASSQSPDMVPSSERGFQMSMVEIIFYSLLWVAIVGWLPFWVAFVFLAVAIFCPWIWPKHEPPDVVSAPAGGKL